MKFLTRWIKSLKENGKFRRVRREFLTVLAAIVVFVTTYALILPAITMDVGIASHSPGVGMNSNDGLVEDDEAIDELEGGDDSAAQDEDTALIDSADDWKQGGLFEDDDELVIGYEGEILEGAEDYASLEAVTEDADGDLIFDAEPDAPASIGGIGADLHADLIEDEERTDEADEADKTDETGIAETTVPEAVESETTVSEPSGTISADLDADLIEDDEKEADSKEESDTEIPETEIAENTGVKEAASEETFESTETEPVEEMAADAQEESDLTEAASEDGTDDKEAASEEVAKENVETPSETEAGTETAADDPEETEALAESESEGEEALTEDEEEGKEMEAVTEEASEEPENITEEASEESEAITEEESEELEAITEGEIDELEDLTEGETEELEDITEGLEELEDLTEAETKEEAEEIAYLDGALDPYKGDGYTVYVSCTENAEIPANAYLDVREIDPVTDAEEYQFYLAYSKRAMGLGEDDELPPEQARFFDITILAEQRKDDGDDSETVIAEIEPRAAISVQIVYDEAIEFSDTESPQMNALHFAEEGKDPDVLDTQMEVQETAIAEQDEVGDEETVVTSVTAVSFDTNSFSVFGIVYTVDFTYNGFTYNLEGDTEISLGLLLEKLHITEDVLKGEYDPAIVQNVIFTKESLVAVEHRSDDWYLISLEPFTSFETLTVYLLKGDKIVIDVTDAQVTSNLNAVLTGLTIENSSGESVITDGNSIVTTKDESYDITFTFSETKNGLQFDNESTLIYTVPDGVTLQQDGAHNFDIVIGNRVITGNTYEVYTDSDGKQKIRVNFNTTHRNFRYLKTSEDIEFTLNFKASFSNTVTQVVFGTDSTFGYSAQVKDEHNASVRKTGYYDANWKKMVYKAIVHSDKGASENVRVVDTLSGTALSNAQITGVYISDQWGNSKGQSASYTLNNNTNGFDLTLPRVDKDQYITIEYTADINYGNIANNGNATFSETGNTVTIDVPGDKDSSDNTSTHEEKGITYSSIQKVSTGTGDVITENGRQYRIVDWKVTANAEGIVSLKGSNITDTLLDADDTQYYGDGITVVKKNNGSVVATENKPWSSVGVSDKTTASSWSYAVTDDGNYSYEITYQTKVDITDWKKSKTISNAVKSKYDEDTGKVTIDTEVSTSARPVVTKTATNVSEETTTWKISVDIPANYSGDLKIEELIPRSSDGVYGDTLNSITVSGLTGEEDYSVYTNKLIKYDGKTVLGDDKAIIQFYQGKLTDSQKRAIANGEDPGSLPTKGVTSSSSNRTITITVVTNNDEAWMKAGDAGGNYLAYHTNKATGYDKDGSTGESSDKVMPLEQSLVKGNAYNLSGVTYQYVDSSGKYWTIPCFGFSVTLKGVNTSNVDIIETFDTDLFKLYEGELNYTPEGHLRLAYGNDVWGDGGGKTVNGVSFEPTSTGGIIHLTDLPRTSGNAYYSLYTVSYYLTLNYNRNDQSTVLETLKKYYAEIAEKGTPVTDANGNVTGKTYNFSNTAEWDTAKDTYEYSAKISNILNKTGNYDSNAGKYQYTITFNPDKLRLNGKRNFDLQDVLKGVTVDKDTVQITTEAADGSPVTCKMYTSEEQAAADTEYDGIIVICPEDGSELTLHEIPDETKLVITYKATPTKEARVNKDTGKAVAEVSNTVDVLDYHYRVEDTHEYDFISKTKEDHDDGTITFTIDFNGNQLKLNGGKAIELTDTYTGDLSINENSFAVVADPETAFVDGQSVNVSDYVLTRKSKSGTTYSFQIPDQTHVTITYTGQPVYQTQQDGEIKYDYTNTAKAEDVPVVIEDHVNTKILSKTDGEMVLDARDDHYGYIPFEVVFNPLQQTLNNGNVIELTDAYENLLVDYSSISITTVPTERASEVEYDYSGTTGTYQIPDSTKVIITYYARPDFSKASEVDWSNIVQANGYRDDTGNHASQETSGSGHGSLGNILWLYKYEAGHMERPMDGMTFKLYMDVNGQVVPVTRKDGSQVTFTTGDDEEKHHGYVLMSLEGTGDQEVDAQFKNSSNGFIEDTIYYLQEVGAAVGYYENTIMYNFVVHEGLTSTYNKPDYMSGQTVYLFEKDDIVKVTNTKITDSISVSKKWIDEDGIGTWPENVESVEVKIQKVIGDADPVDMTGSNVPAYYWDGTNHKAVQGEDGSTWSDTITLTREQQTGAWSKLDLGDNVSYIVTEVSVNGVSVVDGSVTANDVAFDVIEGWVRNGKVTLTNAARTSFQAEKNWADNIDTDDYSVVVKLHQFNRATGEEITSFTVNDQEKTLTKNNWSAEWTDLPTAAMIDGTLVEYTYAATEEAVYEGTDTQTDIGERFTAVTVTEDGKTTITNTSKDSLNLDVEKVWNDTANNAMRPASITVHLYSSEDNYATALAGKDLTLSAANSWKGGWTDLDAQYTYKVAEESVQGYTASYSKADGKYEVRDGKNLSGDKITITNTRTTSTTGSIEIKKVWVDGEEQILHDNEIGATDVSFELTRESKQGGETTLAQDEVTVYFEYSYQAPRAYEKLLTFSAVPGSEVTLIYNIPKVSWGSATLYNVYAEQYTENNGYTPIPNVRMITSGTTQTITVPIPESYISDKVVVIYTTDYLNDNNAIDSVRASLQESLSVNGDTNTYPITLTLSNANNWYASQDGLDPAHNTYYLEEIVPSGADYEPIKYTINGTDVNLTQTDNGKRAEVTTGTVIVTNKRETTEYTVQKRFTLNSVGVQNWIKDYGSGELPDYAVSKVYFKLYRKISDTEKYAVDEYGQKKDKVFEINYGDTFTATGEYKEGDTTYVAVGDELHYVYHFSNLPKGNYEAVECNEDGREFTSNNVDGVYMTCPEDSAHLFVMKNIVTSVTAEKNWEDDGNEIALHPDVTFELQKKVGDGGWIPVDTKILSEAHKDDEDSDYHEPGVSTDGTEITHPYVEWNYLPVWDFDAWLPITYRTVEKNATSIEGYRPDDVSSDGNVYGTTGYKHTTFTNRLQFFEVEAKKNWENDNDNKVPEGAIAKLQLFRHTASDLTEEELAVITMNGTRDQDENNNTWDEFVNTAEAHEDQPWQANWLKLPKYKFIENEDGTVSAEEWIYTVKEIEGPSGYTAFYGTRKESVELVWNGARNMFQGTFTNREMRQIEGTKIWNDTNEHTNNAEDVVLQLTRKVGRASEETAYVEGTGAEQKVVWKTVGAQTDTLWQPQWTGDKYVYANLPKCDDNDDEYTYSVAEVQFNAGGVTYYVEKVQNGFKVYTMDGGRKVEATNRGVIQSGNTITNDEYIDLHFTKKWTNGDNVAREWPKDAEGKTDTSKYILVTLKLELIEKGTNHAPMATYMNTFMVLEDKVTSFEQRSTVGTNILANAKVTGVYDEETGLYTYTISGLEKSKYYNSKVCDCRYTISEEQVPGYNMPTYTVSNQDVSGAETDLEEITDRAGQTISRDEYETEEEENVKNYRSSTSKKRIYVEIKDGGTVNITNRLITVALPATGGIGTTIFYVVGAVLVVAALILLIAKRGAGKEEDEEKKS